MLAITLTKYWSLLSVSWQNGLVYRMSVFMWRIRRFLAALMSLTIWTTIYANSGSAHFGYTQSDMISYIFLVSILQNVVLASAIQGLASEVYSGAISNQLLKPISITGYLAMQEVADKLKNTSAMIFEFIALFFIFMPSLVLPTLQTGILFVLLTFGAIILNFFISLLFGSIGFWSPDTWGPRFLFYTLMQFTAGQLFPLDVLPDLFQKVIYATPLPYLSFLQTQVFLGKFSSPELWRHSIVLLVWIAVTGLASHIIWKKGLRDYDAAGR